MTDDVLIEICAFIIGFGELAKTKVSKRVLKKFGNILEVSLPNNNNFPKAVDVISKVTEVDYQLLAELQRRTKAEVLERYRPIYT